MEAIGNGLVAVAVVGLGVVVTWILYFTDDDEPCLMDRVDRWFTQRRGDDTGTDGGN